MPGTSEAAPEWHVQWGCCWRWLRGVVVCDWPASCVFCLCIPARGPCPTNSLVWSDPLSSPPHRNLLGPASWGGYGWLLGHRVDSSVERPAVPSRAGQGISVPITVQLPSATSCGGMEAWRTLTEPG